MARQKTRWLAATIGPLCFGVLIGRLVPAGSGADAQVAVQVAAPPLSFPMVMRTGGNLYLQTSAEYQAACLQIYRAAGERLRNLTANKVFVGLPPAVVMDLDETVFDNSAFQTYLYRTGREYGEDLWGNYEKNFDRDVTLIPGAKPFIDEAAAAGVRVLFVSNRLKQNQASTVAALERLGIAGTNVADRLFLKQGTSDKTPRRAEVAARYQVLLLLGDNLRDFSEEFVAPPVPARPTAQDIRAAIAGRKAAVERTADHWGTDWFILPNPVYGEWDKLIQVDPTELMHPTSMTAPRNP